MKDESDDSVWNLASRSEWLPDWEAHHILHYWQKVPMSTLTDLNTTDAPSHVETQANGSEKTSASTKTILAVEEIHKLLPHRYPFSLVDRIIEYVPGERAVGIKNVTFNEPHFQGHFPGRPIMPGVLIVEAMAQVGGVVLTQMSDVQGGLFLFAGID